MNQTKNEEIEQSLLHYYRNHPRDLPWKEVNNPYYTYLSETMLQQTRTATVIPYFLRFIEKYPTIQNLALANEDEVLKLWQGLGYYSRARNLLKSAKVICSRFKGIIPSKKEELLSLPGVGEYIANAVLAFAYDQKNVAVDANLFRIFSRLQEYSFERSNKSEKECEEFFFPVLGSNPGIINQTLMDIGEVACLSKKPKCGECPLSSFCRSFHDNSTEYYPVKAKRKARKTEEKTVFLLRYHPYLYLEKRPDSGLLASLYEPYTTKGNLNLEEAKKHLVIQGLSVSSIQDIGNATHIFTHLIWNLHGYLVELKTPASFLVPATKEDLVTKYSIPSAYSPFLKKNRLI